ncbi:unnamed protein product [Sphagnum balticum]
MFKKEITGQHWFLTAHGDTPIDAKLLKCRRHFALVCHRRPATGRATSPWRAGGGARDERTTKGGERQAGQADYGQAQLAENRTSQKSLFNAKF